MVKNVKINIEAKYTDLERARESAKRLQKQLVDIPKHVGKYSQWTKVTKQLAKERQKMADTEREIAQAQKAPAKALKEHQQREKELASVRKKMWSNAEKNVAVAAKTREQKEKQVQQTHKQIWKTMEANHKKFMDERLQGTLSVAKRTEKANLSSASAILKNDNMLKKSAKGGFQSIDSVLGNINTKIKKSGLDSFGAKIKKNEMRFQGWALSVMFFGMALQRMATSIWKFGTSTFQEISNSVEGTTTHIQMLNGSMKFLGFIVGQALEPIAEWLTPIIIKFAEWLEEHQGLVRWVVIGATVLGGLFTIIGMLTLGLAGVISTVKNVIVVFKTMTGLFKALKTGGLLTKVGGMLKAVFLSPVTWIILLIAGLVLVIVWIVKLAKKMGGFGEFMKSVLRGLLRFIMIIGEGLVWVVMKVWDGIKWLLNGIIDGVNWIIKKVNRLLGTDIGMIGNLGKSQYMFGDAILSNYLEKEQTGWLAPEKGYAEFGGVTPTYNISTINVENPQSMQTMLDEINKMQTGG